MTRGTLPKQSQYALGRLGPNQQPAKATKGRGSGTWGREPAAGQAGQAETGSNSAGHERAARCPLEEPTGAIFQGQPWTNIVAAATAPRPSPGLVSPN